MNDNSSTFSKLKPKCLNFLKRCNIENINALEDAVKELDTDSVESLQEYITLPVIVSLKGKLNEKLTIKCIDFLSLIFKKSKVRDWNYFYDMFCLLVSKISNKQDACKVNCGCEELKSSVCESILCLVRCSTEEILNEMYSLSFRPYLAHAFFLLAIMLKEEKSKSLIKVVLQTIGGLTYNKKYIGNKFRITELIASEALASCLPGLSIALQKVISGDDKQAHGIIIIALNIFTDLVTLTVGDESYERGISKDTSSEIHCFAYKSGNLSRKLNLSNYIPCDIKNDTWYKSVTEKLVIIIQNFMIITTHDHWKVRLAFLNFAKSLLYKCNKTMKDCISVLLPAIFGLSADSNADVSSYAKDILVSVTKDLKSMSFITLNETVEDNIEKLIAQLVTCKISANDNKKLSILKSLLGYLDISGLSLNNLLFSSNQLERFFLTLMTLLEFEISEINFVEELTATEDFNAIHIIWPKKKFKLFENEEILSIICRIFNSLACIGNSRVLIDYLLEKLSSNDLYTLQCIFVIGSVIKSLSEETDASQKYSMLISDILEVFLSPSLLDVPIYNNNIERQVTEVSHESPISNNTLNRNKLKICLLLEAIASCSECLKTEFKQHLMKVLCPVMQKAGSVNYAISHCGRLCLYHIANVCQYKSVQELIKDNADYITNLIMIHFHQYLHKPEISVVLRVAMEYSDAEAVILFRDLIFQILDVLDYNQDKAYPLLQVLFAVVVCIKKWFPSKKNGVISNISTTNNVVHKSLKTAVKNYMDLKKMVFDSESDCSSKDLNTPEFENIDDENCDSGKKVPLHINIACEIFKRCVHLQSSGNQYVRMLTLETVEQCIFVLRDYETQLHPLVHQFWSPFLQRFTEDAFIPKAFNVLLTIANECGDFIRSRTFKDVMPKLVFFLQKNCTESLLQHNFKHYQWTSEHSLQILLLSEAGNLCTKLDIDEKDINAVATVCISYLSKEQPKILQEAAVKSLRALSTIDADALWFYWNVVYCKKDVLLPPHEDLLELIFPHSNKSSVMVIDL